MGSYHGIHVIYTNSRILGITLLLKFNNQMILLFISSLMQCNFETQYILFDQIYVYKVPHPTGSRYYSFLLKWTLIKKLL